MLELWSHVVLGEQFRAACIPFLMSPFAIVVASKHAAQIHHACRILEVLSTGRCSKPALRQSLGSSDPQALGWVLGGGKDASLHEILELTSGRDSDWKAVSSSRQVAGSDSEHCEQKGNFGFAVQARQAFVWFVAV